VLRARTPDGIEQELYALLVTYQALRTAIADAAAAVPGTDPPAGVTAGPAAAITKASKYVRRLST
jgi:hypothetical protein